MGTKSEYKCPTNSPEAYPAFHISPWKDLRPCVGTETEEIYIYKVVEIPSHTTQNETINRTGGEINNAAHKNNNPSIQ
jgi:hypothetical protein